MPVTILCTQNGNLDEKDKAKFAELQNRLQTNLSPQILLYLHGGLVDEAAGKQIAERLSRETEDSLQAPSDWEQVYVVWRTGWAETLLTRWQELAQNDRLYQSLIELLIAFVSRKVSFEMLEGGARNQWHESPDQLNVLTVRKRIAKGNLFDDKSSNPAWILHESEEDLERKLQEFLLNDSEDPSKHFTQARDDLASALASNSDIVKLKARSVVFGGNPSKGQVWLNHLNPDIQKELQNSVDIPQNARASVDLILMPIVRRAVQAGVRVIRRYRTNRHHGLYATVVEELTRQLYGAYLGTDLWAAMKNNAKRHMESEGLGGQLLEIFDAHPRAQIRLVGHSAGSIWLSELLLASSEAASWKADVIFLAPAVRTKLFARVLQERSQRFNRFKMYALSESLELSDAVLGPKAALVYPSSLLYLVSGLCETEGKEEHVDAPLLGMQRYLNAKSVWLDDAGEGTSLKAIQDFLAAENSRIVYAQCDDSQARTHGAFDDDPATLRSVLRFLQRTEVIP